MAATHFYHVGQTVGYQKVDVIRYVRITHIVHIKGRQRLYFQSPTHVDNRTLSVWNTQVRGVH